MGTRIAPALAAGCAVIIKLRPILLTILALMPLLEEAKA
jgi:acyl-CoA reductase-like NAD-dependent aldehyde dehydrogenase